LKSTPSTGFSWYIVSDYSVAKEIDNEKTPKGAKSKKVSTAPIEVISTTYESSVDNKKRLGAPGIEKFCIRAVKDVSVDLKFAYARYWEMNADGDGDFETRVVHLKSDRDLEYYELLYDFS
jgi:predicted secreted protein